MESSSHASLYTKKPLTIIALFVLLIIFILLTYYSLQNKNNFSSFLPDSIYPSESSVASTTIPWLTFTDIKYGYSYNYPYDDKQNYNFTVEALYTTTTKNLEAYAQYIWTLNKNDRNPYTINKSVTPLIPISLNERPAFTFTIQGENASYIDDYGGEIVTKDTTFIFTSNQDNTFFLIRYSTNNPVSEKILSTLKIDTKLIAPKIKPVDWRIYTDADGVISFSYPANIFNKRTTDIHGNLNVSGNRGNLGAYIHDKILDQNNIHDGYDVVKNPKKVKVGNLYGYSYRWGDAGSTATRVEIPIDNKTLVISFNSYIDDIYPIADDEALQIEILSTFKIQK